MNGNGATATIEAPAQSKQDKAAVMAEQEDLAARAVVAARHEGPLTREKVDEVRNRLRGDKEEAAIQPKESPKPKAEKEAKVEGEKPKPGPKAGEKAAKEQRQNATLARHALKREGWDDEEIDGLAPDALITVGLKFKAKQDADPERNSAVVNGQRTAQTKDQDGSGKREGEGPKDRPTGPREQDRSAALGPDQDGPASEELERVYEQLTDDAKEILGRHIETDLGKAERFVRKAQEAEKAAVKAAQKARDEMFSMRRSMVRSTLEREFPQIADDSRFEGVEEFMEKLAPRSQWGSMEAEQFRELMSDAAAAEFGREAIKAARAKHAQELSDDLAGQPHVGGTKASDRASKDSVEDLAVRAVLESRGNNGDARARLSRLKGV